MTTTNELFSVPRHETGCEKLLRCDQFCVELDAFLCCFLLFRCIVSLLPFTANKDEYLQESLALATMARDDPPASSTASSTAAAMRGKVGSEFET